MEPRTICSKIKMITKILSILKAFWIQLKKMIEGITKKAPSEQQLYNKEDTGMGQQDQS